MKNLGLKIFSLTVAILLSYFIPRNEGVIGVTVPVELKGMPANKIVVKPLVRQVQVSIKGPSYLISQVYASPPTFRVKVPKEVGSKMTASLEAKDLVLPPSVTVMRVDPSQMEFVFDSIVRKEVPVKLLQTGALPGALKLSEIAVSPSRVEITGPETELAKINFVETEGVDLSTVNSETEKDVAIKFDSKLSDISSRTAHIKISVTNGKINKQFENVSVEVRAVAGEIGGINPQKVNVEVIGPKDKVNALDSSQVVPYLRLYQGIVYGKEYEVLIDLPKDISLVKMEPSKVLIIKSPTQKKILKPEGRK